MHQLRHLTLSFIKVVLINVILLEKFELVHIFEHGLQLGLLSFCLDKSFSMVSQVEAIEAFEGLDFLSFGVGEGLLALDFHREDEESLDSFQCI
jgi:hypothetical protein